MAKHPDQTGSPKPVQTTAAQWISTNQAQTNKRSSTAKNRDYGQATSTARQLRHRSISRAQSASKLAKPEQNNARTVARDTDKLPRPHPLWSWTGSSHTSQQERMSKLDHSVTRSFDRSMHRIKHQPTAASARCFSNFSGCPGCVGLMASLLDLLRQDQAGPVARAPKKGHKKTTSHGGGFFGVGGGDCFSNQHIINLYLKMFYLASSYFLRGLPPKYRRR